MLPLKSHISPDIFLHIPPPATANLSTRTSRLLPRIIFFITGNPGLVAYYHAFLARLSTANATAEACVVAGFSLGGFEIEGGDGDGDGYSGGKGESNPDDLRELQFPDTDRGDSTLPLGDDDPQRRTRQQNSTKKRIYSLEEQIVLTQKRMAALAERVREVYGGIYGGGGGGAEPEVDVEVILVGHSVGAYVVLELIHRHRHRHAVAKGQKIKGRQGNGDADHHLPESPDACCGGSTGFAIKGAILLTPTISHIAQSRSGKILAPLTRLVPILPVLGAVAARALVGVLPDRWLRGVVGWVAGMDGDVDGPGGGVGPLGATVAFLRSDGGVRQALQMAGEEMRVIGEERWGEEVWGAAAEMDVEVEKGAGATVVDEVAKGRTEGDVRAGGQRRIRTRPPKLIFYFAKTDHWVADHTRDELQRLRGRVDGKEEEWKPEMVVDEEDGLVHGWCIRQSGLVAGKVARWIEAILSER